MRRLSYLYMMLLGIGLFTIQSCKKDGGDNNNNTSTNPDAILLDSATTDLISTEAELADGIYRFNIENLGLRNSIKEGSILAGYHGDGYLRRVTSVSIEGEDVTCETEQGYMSELYTDANLEAMIDLGDSEMRNSSLRLDLDSVSLDVGGGGSFSFKNGSYVEFGASPVFDIEFEEGALSYCKVAIENASLVSDMDIHFVAPVSGLSVLDGKKELASWKKFQLLYLPGSAFPVPAMVETKIMANYKVGVNAALTATWEVNSDHSITLGGEYKDGAWTDLKSSTSNASLVPSASHLLSGEVSVSLVPEVSVKFFGVVGPKLGIGTKAEFKGNATSTGEWDFEFKAGIDLEAGIEADLILDGLKGKYNKSWSLATFYEYKTPTEMSKVSGENQSGQANQVLAEPIKVKVVDSFGDSQSEVQVSFSVVEGGGGVNPSTVTTDADGYAEVLWTLGTSGNQRVEAVAKKADNSNLTGAPIEFTAEIQNCVAVNMVEISGNNQSGEINRTLSVPVKVQLQTSDGTGCGGEVVTFTVLGDGSVSSSTVIADADGYAEVLWTLGSAVGAQSLEVSSAVGSPITFNATGTQNGNTFTDPRDGEVYEIVTIGGQTWFAENLRYNAAGSWYNSANPDVKYGRLYDWATVMNGATSSSASPSGVQGICPSGWHLPSDAEWSTLEIALGMDPADATTTGWRGTHGTSMKSTIGWNSNGNGDNSSGFNAFPVGYYFSGSFYGLGTIVYFWSSTEYSATNVRNRYLFYMYSGGARDYGYKTHYLSCRCVQN